MASICLQGVFYCSKQNEIMLVIRVSCNILEFLLVSVVARVWVVCAGVAEK